MATRPPKAAFGKSGAFTPPSFGSGIVQESAFLAICIFAIWVAVAVLAIVILLDAISA